MQRRAPPDHGGGVAPEPARNLATTAAALDRGDQVLVAVFTPRDGPHPGELLRTPARAFEALPRLETGQQCRGLECRFSGQARRHVCGGVAAYRQEQRFGAPGGRGDVGRPRPYVPLNSALQFAQVRFEVHGQASSRRGGRLGNSSCRRARIGIKSCPNTR